MATSDAVRGASLLTNFWKTVEEEIRLAGGTDVHLGELVTKKMRPAIREFAKLVVETDSFAGQIRAGNYSIVSLYNDNVREIRGQKYHPVTDETWLDFYPSSKVIIEENCANHADQMADLSELLDFGIKNPEAQTQFSISIYWQDAAQRFWFARLSCGGLGNRTLVINLWEGGPLSPSESSRILRRK